MEREVEPKFRIIYYPFMGTSVNTERLILLARLCYKPIGVDGLYDMVWGTDSDPVDPGLQHMDDEAVGKFVRGLIRSGHLGALEHWNTSFAVEGYSRISSQQNDRHRLMKTFKDPGVLQAEAAPEGGRAKEACEAWVNGPEQGSADVSQMQQSQRYVREDDFKYVVPPSFHKDPEFLARYRKLQEDIAELQRYGLNEAKLPAEDVRFGLSNATETRFVITTNARQLRHMFNLRCCQRAQWEIRDLFDGLLREYKKIAPNIFWRAGASCEDFGYCPEGSASCGRAPTIDQLLDSAGRKRED
ncbi:MAG: FAD-dependent thymidylate synthase [Bacillota bacterium]|jgi:thymidylate synthase (FAD)|nr:FAD-dependent thymidylate synthase [Bacillota bacterium]HOK71962.1 FAD-dependent thymidylate synthase [Bacillota bacterium]HOO30947.1 FAD-dependent thymidylate synthase [Bacillota bacterium]